MIVTKLGHLYGRKFCYITVGLLLIGNFLGLFLVQSSNNILDLQVSPYDRVLSADEISGHHDPISIDGNEDFATQASSEGWSGDGSEDNPIIINNLLIEASNNLIWISNTNLHFQISNCILDGLGGGTGGGGISLNSVSNGYIKNNTILNFESVGIYLEQSFDCIITGNNVHHSTQNEGIFLAESGNNIISSNFVHDNELVGVVFHLSYHNLFSNNQVSFNSVGLSINSYNNTILSNTFSENTGSGVIFDSSSSNSIVKWNNFVGNYQGYSQASDGGSSNEFINNYWDDQTGPDENSDGIVDNFYNILGPAFNRDLFPLVNAHELQQPTLIYPNGGETLKEIATIRWSSSTDSHDHEIIYSIYFSTDNGLIWTSIASGLETTSYNWETRRVSSGSTYLIKVVATCAEGLIITDNSDGVFTINNRLSRLNLFSPTGGQTVGGSITIQWTPVIDSDGQDVTYSLFYSVDNGSTWNLIVAELGTTSYTWNIRGLPEDSSCLIKVKATSSDDISTEVLIEMAIIIDNIGPPPDFSLLMTFIAIIFIIPEFIIGRKVSNFVNRQSLEEGVETP